MLLRALENVPAEWQLTFLTVNRLKIWRCSCSASLLLGRDNVRRQRAEADKAKVQRNPRGIPEHG